MTTPELVGNAGIAGVAITPRRQPWTAALAAMALLAYFLWAGSSYDPRHAALWTLTKAVTPGPGVSDWQVRWSGGWLVPAPGLGQLFIAGAMVFAGLSMVAYRVLPAGEVKEAGGEKNAWIWQAVIVAAIFVVALDVRLVVLRAWRPLPLEPAIAVARTFRPAMIARGPAILADLATLAVLFVALAVRGRSLWLATLFAFHPVMILESAGNGSHVAWILPLVVLAAMGWRLHRWARELVIMGAAAGGTWWVAHLALGQRPFNGLFAECLTLLSIEGSARALGLIAVEMVLQGVVVWLAFRQGWTLARTLGHIFVVWALVSPRVVPADVLPLIALLPLAWNRAGWVLSGTILWTYAIFPLADPAIGWRLPTWLIFVIFVPVLVVEVEDLLSAAWRKTVRVP